MKQSLLTLLAMIFTLVACQDSSNNSKNQQTSTTTKTSTKAATDPIISDRWADYEYRNENWRPEEGAYYFSEIWTWSYHNELVDEKAPNYRGEFAIYLDPPSGTILLEKNASRYGDEMTDWIIVHPNGNYITGFTDVHGKPNVVKQKMSDFPNHEFLLTEQPIDFKKNVKKQTEQKTFGGDNASYIYSKIDADHYKMKFERTDDIVDLYLAELPFSLRAFYLANKTNSDLQFPINLEYGYLLPDNYLVIKEDYKYGEASVGYQLKSIYPTSYFVNTVTYKLDH